MSDRAQKRPRSRKPKAERSSADSGASRGNGILFAALAHVPADGFTDKALEKAARETGADKGEMARLFPEGPLSLVEAFSRWADGEMVKELAHEGLADMK